MGGSKNFFYTLAFNQSLLCMSYGIRKGLEDISHELKGIRTILNSMWQSRYGADENTVFNPEAFADEYISTEECARRLQVSDQTVRNWIAIGRKTPDKGWIESVHYVNIAPDSGRKAVIRIPWNGLVQSFAKNRKTITSDYYTKRNMYQSTSFGKLD
jgi:hypothetical protein